MKLGLAGVWLNANGVRHVVQVASSSMAQSMHE
jgi:hypothetical protein